MAGDSLTRFRRRLVVDYICLDDRPTVSGSPNANYLRECVATSGAGCPGFGSGACVGYNQFIGHRVQSRVQVTNRKGGDLEVVALEDYLYAWK